MLKTSLALLVMLLAAAPRAESSNTVAAQKLAALSASSSVLALSNRPAYYRPQIDALAAQNVFPPAIAANDPGLLAYLAQLDALQASIDADAARYAAALPNGSNLVLTGDEIPRTPNVVFFHGVDMWQYYMPRTPPPTPMPTPTPTPPSPTTPPQTSIPSIVTPPPTSAPIPQPPPTPPAVQTTTKTVTAPPSASKNPKAQDLAALYASKMEKLDAKIEEASLLEKREKERLSEKVKNFAAELKKNAKLTASEAQTRFDKITDSVAEAIAAAKEKAEREKNARGSKP